jgi:AraC-like DNA-binding protein
MTPSPHSDEAKSGEYPGIALDSPARERPDGSSAAPAPVGAPAGPATGRPIGSRHRELGLTLYRLRLERGLSLRALARCLGYSSHSAFADFEKARRMPGESLMIAYERLFELPHGPLVALRSQALAERAAWLTAVRGGTAPGTPALGTPTPGTPARLPAAQPARTSFTASGDRLDPEVTRVHSGIRVEESAFVEPPRPRAATRRRPKAADGLAALGAVVANLLGRRRATYPTTRE